MQKINTGAYPDPADLAPSQQPRRLLGTSPRSVGQGRPGPQLDVVMRRCWLTDWLVGVLADLLTSLLTGVVCCLAGRLAG